MNGSESYSSILSSERESQGIDIVSMARRLHIRPDILKAIETADFERMPAKGYAKNMIRAYARTLGLNPSFITDLYLHDVARFEAGSSISATYPSGYSEYTSNRQSRALNNPSNSFDSEASAKRRVSAVPTTNNNRHFLGRQTQDFDEMDSDPEIRSARTPNSARRYQFEQVRDRGGRSGRDGHVDRGNREGSRGRSSGYDADRYSSADARFGARISQRSKAGGDAARSSGRRSNNAGYDLNSRANQRQSQRSRQGNQHRISLPQRQGNIFIDKGASKRAMNAYSKGYPNIYSDRSGAVASRLPIFVIIAILAIVIIVALVIFLNSSKQSAETVPDIPISGLTDTSDPEDTSSTVKAIAPTSATFTYSVDEGGESWIMIYENDSENPSVAEVVSGPSESSIEVTGTLSFMTANSGPVHVYVNGEEVQLTQDSDTSYFVYEVDFAQILEQWNQEHPEATETSGSSTASSASENSTTSSSSNS